MANTSNSDKWYFTKEQLENTPSRKCGFDAYKELSHRQQAANFIQDMGQRLKVSQLCINTAIVYMHRFYVFHSFTQFPWYQMGAAALFLAAKVEEQPRKLEHVIKVGSICRNPKDTSFDSNSERYQAQATDLVFNENTLLQTLGFDFAIDHPHTHVVRCCHLVRASKDLAQTSYFMASNSLHLTTMCIQYKPTVVACFCILVACKWSNWEIPLSNEKKEWFSYVDPTVTAELLQQLTEEFFEIFENCPSRLKEKIMAISDQNTSHPSSSNPNSPFETEPKKLEGKDHPALSMMHRPHDSKSDSHKHRSSWPHDPLLMAKTREQREREYKERKDREKMAAQRQAMMSGQSLKHSHHHSSRLPNDPKLKSSHSGRPPSVPTFPSSGARVEPRDILREAAKDSPFGLAKDHSRDPQQQQFKDVHKRDYLLKPNVVQTDTNSLLNNYADGRYNSADKQRVVDLNRSRSGDIVAKPVMSVKPDVRKLDEQKPYNIKTDPDSIKKHLSAGLHDNKNSAYLTKSSSSTSQKIKSPFTVDMSKSVPKMNNSTTHPQKMLHQHNGNSNIGCSSSSNGSYSNSNPSIYDSELNINKVKQEPEAVKEEIPTPAVIKRPSLFSPPDTTPPHVVKPVKIEIKDEQQHPSSLLINNITPLSPISTPEVASRTRNFSTSSEPELRPVMEKIDQVEGFENLMRDNTIGMNHVPNIPVGEAAPTAEGDVKQETPLVNHNTKPIVNGLETNPLVISNLLKETPTVVHLPIIAATDNTKAEPQAQQLHQIEVKEKSHHKSKKKKEKHKNKDKDRSREDKDKKKKHKDKDREKHKHKVKHEVVEQVPVISEPIKIKIQKDKIQPLASTSSPLPSSSSMALGGLKIKIPKDKIKTESIADLPQPSLTMPTGSLKIKIPKDKISNCHPSSCEPAISSSSKKRERDRTSPNEAPPSKMPRTSSSSRESKQNGRHSYNKVTHMGDGETSHRLAESKYTSKSSS